VTASCSGVEVADDVVGDISLVSGVGVELNVDVAPAGVLGVSIVLGAREVVTPRLELIDAPAGETLLIVLDAVEEATIVWGVAEDPDSMDSGVVEVTSGWIDPTPRNVEE
jgi:hypothetical protein